MLIAQVSLILSLSLAICPYQPLLLENLLDSIRCLHSADEFKFVLVAQL